MKRWILAVVLWAITPWAASQSWDIPYRSQGINVDGYLDEWAGVPTISLRPGGSAVLTEGEFQEGDLEVQVKSVWNESALYLAIEWKDNVWDVEEVRRRDAVFVTPDRKRRDRMLFFDYFKLQIHELEFDFLLWLSPRVNDRGPYFWHRRLKGVAVRERATPDPVITPREHDDGRVTLEVMLTWKDLELKAKKLQKQGLPLTLFVADSDQPGSILESKLAHLKWLEWSNRVRLTK